MKKQKARHLWHGVFAFFILLSFFGALILLESQGSLITGFVVSEVSADSPIMASLSIGAPFTFLWQGQEYSLKASTISLGEGKAKLEVSKAGTSSAAAAPAATTTSTRTGTTPTTTATSPTRTTTSTTTTSPTTIITSSARTATSTTATTPTSTSIRTTTTTPTTTTRSSTTTTTALAKCQDKIDNDKDGRIDYPADRGCISLKDNDETDTAATSTTSTRTTTTTPTTTTARSTTTATTSGSTVTGRATVATTTTAVRSPTTTTTTSAVPKTTTVSSPSKKLGDLELLKTEEFGFDLDGDGSEDIIFTLMDVLSTRQAKVEIKIKEKIDVPTEDKISSNEPAPDGTAAATIIGNVIYSNDLIAVKELLDDAGQPTASYEVTYSFNEINKRIPFSFPCKPDGVTSIEDNGALGGIKDKIKAVYSYDADEKWLVWNPDGGAASNMQEYFLKYFPDDSESAQFFFGYYLVVTEKTELTITCSDFGAEKFGMIPGWNVFGIHGMEEKEAGEFLKESTEISEINEFKDGKIQKLSDKKKTKLQPGKVYWWNLKKVINLQNPAGIVPGEGP